MGTLDGVGVVGRVRGRGRNHAEVVYGVLERLRLRADHLPLIGFGSVITGLRLFWHAFCEAVAEFAPGIQPARLCLPPVACHALSALRSGRAQQFAAVQCRLRETLAPVLGCELPRELEYA